ncbi:MAG: murein transglycosylase domain-containing protein [Bacteroidota bacterium]
MKLNIVFLYFILVILCSVYAIAQDQKERDEFEKFKKEQEQGVQKEEESFQQYKAEVTKQYNDYVAEQERLFKEYTGQIEKKWGRKNVQTSTKKEYVAYDEAFSSRKKIDFESGTAKVEVLVTEAEAKNQNMIREKLKEQVAKVVTTKGGDDPLEKKMEVSAAEKPLVAGQVQMTNGVQVTEQNAKQFAEQTVRSSPMTTETVEGKDGIKRVVVGVQIPLVPNHVKKRATGFKEQIQKEAVRFGIDVTLIFAIMHTESYFNPQARSYVPAYGLMQLVPKSGARDAYFFVYKRDTLVTGEYLFIPNNNIELGSGYLAKLLTVDFRGVRDPKSRIYCAISAYNTGPGNVAKAFTGKRNVIHALPKINAMTSDQVFDHLRKNLPFEETRSYVAKVSERMGLYNEWSLSN